VKKKHLILGAGLIILCVVIFDVNITYKCQQYYIEEGNDIVKLDGEKINEGDIKVTEIDSISRTGRRYFTFDKGDRECKYIFVKEPYVANPEI
jgi:uncharacterized protein YxeA